MVEWKVTVDGDFFENNLLLESDVVELKYFLYAFIKAEKIWKKTLTPTRDVIL